MKTHITSAGDTVGFLAQKYGVSPDEIMNLNTWMRPGGFGNNTPIPADVKITIPDNKTAIQQTVDKAKEAIKKASSMAPASPPKLDPVPKVMWGNSEVLTGQTGRVTIISPVNLVKKDAKGTKTTIRKLNKGEVYRAFEKTSDGFISLGGNQWVPFDTKYIRFENIPSDIQSAINEGKQISISENTSQKKVATTKPSDFVLFEKPAWQRPALSATLDKKTLSMELRVLRVNSSYSNDIRPTKTNGGWFISVGGANLPSLSVSGFILDTKANQEFDEFMDRYHEYLTGFKDGKYFVMPITTFFYKGREYKGLVNSLVWDDSQAEAMIRNYTLSFIVLSEKNPTGSNEIVPHTATKKGETFESFSRNMMNLLKDPITGKIITSNA